MVKNNETIPIELADDLLCLNLEDNEKVLLLGLTAIGSGTNENLIYEHFLTRNLLEWSQDLSTTAIKL